MDGASRRSALETWHKAAAITKQALQDEDTSDSDEHENLSSDPLERQKQLEERAVERKEREHNARAMSLQYFLEMVDLKHRYGSNLRAYHQEWQKSTSDENFFFWLDHGEGKHLDLKMCPRERLEAERVRYLSKAERLNYLVEIDSEGRLCWEKNGERIDTTVKYRDSVNGISPVQRLAANCSGIVPQDDTSPRYSFDADLQIVPENPESERPSLSDLQNLKEADNRYSNHEITKNKSPGNLLKASPALMFNHLLRKTIRKNTWIFVS